MTKQQRKQQIQNRLIIAGLVAADIVGIALFIGGCERVMAEDFSAPVSGFVQAMNEVELIEVESEEVEVLETVECPYTWEEEDVLAHLIYAEAGNCSDYTMGLVGSVVLNRVDSDFYPDTIYEVIMDHHWGKQYGCSDYFMNKQPSDVAYEVAEELLEQWKLEGTTYLPSNVLGQAGFVTLHGMYCESEVIIFSYY